MFIPIHTDVENHALRVVGQLQAREVPAGLPARLSHVSVIFRMCLLRSSDSLD